MKSVEPQVYCIAETKIDEGGLTDWLKDQKWDECLEHISGSDAERVIELAGRHCYKSFKIGGENCNPNLTKIRTNSEEYIENILKSSHGSVIEHGCSTWVVENVSRIATHELVRHRVGIGISMESGRFCRIEQINYYEPPEIKNNKQAHKIFEETMEYLEEQQHKLAKIYDIDNIKDFKTKKSLTSAFRRIAPEGIATGIVMTFNMRALRWVIENRTSSHAEYEIRLVFNKVAKIAAKRWSYIFQDFEKIDTGDGLFEWVPRYRKV